MTDVVTGVAGFIGSHLASRLLAEGHDVVGIDCFTDYYDPGRKRANVAPLLGHPRFRLAELDLALDPLEEVVSGAACVYHLAAQPGVRGSWGSGFATYVRQNILATQRLLEAVGGEGRRLVYASSSSIYGEAEQALTAEDCLPRPVSPYGVTKLSAEQLVLAYDRTMGLDARCVRYFTVYGPRQRPDMAFSRFIRAARLGEPVEVYGDGSQTRDFTFVTDAVDATVRAGTVDDAGERVFNVGGGSTTSVREVLDILGELLRATGRDPQPPAAVRRCPAHRSRPRSCPADPRLEPDGRHPGRAASPGRGGPRERMTDPGPEPSAAGSVLFVISSLEAGGAERQLIGVAAGLARLGWRVRVVTFTDGGALAGDLAGRGIAVEHLNRHGRWDAGFGWRLVRSIRRGRPDVVHAVPPRAEHRLRAGQAVRAWGPRRLGRSRLGHEPGPLRAAIVVDLLLELPARPVRRPDHLQLDGRPRAPRRPGLPAAPDGDDPERDRRARVRPGSLGSTDDPGRAGDRRRPAARRPRGTARSDEGPCHLPPCGTAGCRGAVGRPIRLRRPGAVRGARSARAAARPSWASRTG